ncbi:protransforming growth factor alpha isoform X1 [Anguilla rostrata]|uniref:protransforming growth factor alpha isoform X1 n=1 Tax=Anguilla rostrata TaxID=7938 RepID=UPI0030D48702
MGRLIWDVIFFLTGSVFTYGQVQENPTTTSAKHPLVAAAVRSHFDDCPDSHSQFCFHGTCRFLIQEETPACVCHPGFVGMRCEHADLLAVVATNQKQQTMTTLLVMCIICCVLLILIFTLLHCCQRCGTCGCGRTLAFDPEKPSNLLKRGAICCLSESVV